MPEAPSLGEILNFGVDSSLGGGSPAVPFDNRQLLSTLNENARFQAENNWKKYNLFQQNLSDIYANLSDVSKLESSPQDREILDKKRKDFLESVWQNPKEFFGSGNSAKRAEIQGKLSELQSTAAKSKMRYVYDTQHRNFLLSTPELDTDENKKIIDDNSKLPLDQWKPYNLTMPTIFDANKLTSDILKFPGVTTVNPRNEYSPDNKFIDEYSVTTTHRDAFLRNWMAAYNLPDKYGHSQGTWAEQEFKKLTPEQKKNLNVETPEDLWRVVGEQKFGEKQDVISKEIGKRIPNPFELEMTKAKGRLDLLKKRESFMYGMEAVRQGNRKDLEQYKQDIRGLNPDQQNESLRNLTDGMVAKAIADGNTIDINGKPHFKMEVSEKVLGIYKKVEGVLKETKMPDDIAVSPDGEEITAVYYKDPKTKEIDESKTRTFSKDEFTLDVGKDIFGVTGLKKMANVKPATDKMVTMVLPDGRTGKIPEDKVAQFLKDNPKAKRQ